MSLRVSGCILPRLRIDAHENTHMNTLMCGEREGGETHTHSHKYACANMREHACAHMLAHARAHAHTHTHTFTRTHTHTHTRTHTYTLQILSEIRTQLEERRLKCATLFGADSKNADLCELKLWNQLLQQVWAYGAGCRACRVGGVQGRGATDVGFRRQGF